MNIIIDIIAVAIIVITALISAKRGFVRTIIELVGFFLVLTLSTLAGNFVAEKIYTETIEKPIVDSVGETIEKSGVNNLKMASVWDSIPDVAKSTLKAFDITEETLQKKYNDNIVLSDNAKIDAQNSAKKIAGEIFKPLFVKILSLFVSAIIFMILSFFVRLIASGSTKLINLTFAKKLNERLGLIFGIPKGFMYAFVFCVVLLIIASITKNGIWIFTKASIDKSYTVMFSKYILKYISPLKYIKNLISL